MTEFIPAQRQKLLPLRAQADLRNAWLRERLDTLLSEPAMGARRRAILLFHRREDGSVEQLTLDRYGYADFCAPCT
jgi:hypothetical protein